MFRSLQTQIIWRLCFPTLINLLVHFCTIKYKCQNCTNFYKCHDGSFICGELVDDLIFDCFDGSDEYLLLSISTMYYTNYTYKSLMPGMKECYPGHSRCYTTDQSCKYSLHDTLKNPTLLQKWPAPTILFQ